MALSHAIKRPKSGNNLRGYRPDSLLANFFSHTAGAPQPLVPNLNVSSPRIIADNEPSIILGNNEDDVSRCDDSMLGLNDQTGNKHQQHLSMDMVEKIISSLQ